MPPNLKWFVSGLGVGSGLGYCINDYSFGKPNQLPKLITGYSRAKRDLEYQLQQSNDYRVKTTLSEKDKIKNFVIPQNEIMLFDKTYQISNNRNKVYCIPNDTQIFMEKYLTKHLSNEMKESVLKLRSELPNKIDDFIDKEIDVITLGDFNALSNTDKT